MMKSLEHTFQGLFVALAVMACLLSCKPSIPSQYLSKSEMEDILYDIHIAQAMADMGTTASGASEADALTYREAVLKKHEVTAAEFDSSMVYYMRHTKLLHDIYASLSDRLTAEAQAMGASVSDYSRFGNAAEGDTANIWRGAMGFVLTPAEGLNNKSFSIAADSTYKPGDKFMFDFDAQFIYQDGMRDGMVVLAMTLQNDSVVTTNCRVTNSQHYSLQLEDFGRLGIKSVKGYFLLNKGDFTSEGSSSTTLKLMFVENIRLVRMHQKKVEAKPEETKGDKADSVSATPVKTETLEPAEVSEPTEMPRRMKARPGIQVAPPTKPIKIEMDKALTPTTRR